MALSKKEKSKMSDVRAVAGTLYAGKQMYDMAKPGVKKVVKKAKDIYKKRKDKRKYPSNTYKQGE